MAQRPHLGFHQPSMTPNTIISKFQEQLSGNIDSLVPHKRHVFSTHAIQQLAKNNREEQQSKKVGFRRPTNSTQKFARQRLKFSSRAMAKADATHRKLAKGVVSNHRQAVRARKKKEKEHRHQCRLAGAMWGYDPMAGRISNSHATEDDGRGCYVSGGVEDDGDEYGVEEIDMLGRRTGRRWLRGSKWGIERGGPGQQPYFESTNTEQL